MIAQPTGDGPGLLVQPGLDRLEVGEQPAAGVDQVPALTGEHHAAAHALEQGDVGLPLQPFDLLGDRARGESQRLGGGHDRAVVVDGRSAVRDARSIMSECYMITP